MKRMWLSLVIVTSLFISNVWAAQGLDGVVAIVNDDVITQSQLNQALKDVRQQIEMSGAPMPSEAELRKQALDLLINKDLQMQVAKRAKLTISDKEVTEAIAKIAAQNKMTVAQLNEAVQRQGMTEQQFRKKIHDEVLLVQLQRKALTGNLNVTDQEVKAYLNSPQASVNRNGQYYIKDILLPLSPNASQEQQLQAKKRAEVLLSDLQKNANIAQVLSENHVQINDLGWRRLNEMPELFAKQISGMKVKSFSAPIQAPNGYHILYLLEDKSNVQKLTTEQAREAVFQRKYQEQVQNWLQQLRAQSYVKIM